MSNNMAEQLKINVKVTDDMLNNLNKQILVMYEDFEDMKRARDDARKQLEARFLDIHKKLQYMQEALNSEGRRVNDSIKAFSSKFDFLLNELEVNFYKTLTEEQEFTKVRFAEFVIRMKELDEVIKIEREDRIFQMEEQVKPIKSHLDRLMIDFDKEKGERLQGEKDIYRSISDEVYKINEKLDREISERNTKLAIQKEENILNFKQKDQHFAEFKIKVMFDLKVLRDEIFLEMENRFNHQNEIVDNISNFLKAFQDTLHVVGS